MYVAIRYRPTNATCDCILQEARLSLSFIGIVLLIVLAATKQYWKIL